MYSLGILNETADGKYSLTPSGEVFTSSHPESLKNAMLWEVSKNFILFLIQKHCDELVLSWNKLPHAIKTGEQSLMAKAMGVSDPWEALNNNPKLKLLFDNAMTSYSKVKLIETTFYQSLRMIFLFS